jgi:SpoIID/LytB domain protein
MPRRPALPARPAASAPHGAARRALARAATGRRARARSAVAAVVVALLAVLGVAVPPAPTATAAEASFTFVGHGWGHGRGMGQYGAYGYAVDHGWSYQQILDHFYGGTRLAADAGNPTVGVQLTRLNGKETIVTGQALAVNGVGTGTAAVLLRREAAGTYAVLTGPGCGGPWTPWTSGNASGVAVTTGADPASAANHLRVCESGSTTGYRGAITAVSSGATQTTVNRVGVDDYLRSVVPSESPASWGNAGGGRGMHALRAQAVAARSYALSGATDAICDTTTCQVYKGSSTQANGAGLVVVEQPQTSQAIAETTGQVRRGANNAVVRTEFSSSTGGWTAGGAFPAVQDLGDATSANPNATWNVTIPQSTVAAKLGTGPIASVAVTARNGLGAEGGRAVTVVLGGTDGRQYSFTGAQVRSALGLKSDWFSVSGVTQAQATKLVQALYQDILGRQPDPVGLNTWTTAVMAGGDTTPVAGGIVMSYERLNTFVRRQYQAALNRQPDPVGTDHWIRGLQQGMTVPELQVQVYASQEGLNVLGRGDLSTWVDGVYRGVLGRSASDGDRRYWVSQVQATDRWVVARAIVLSDEAALLRLNEYYTLMLGRNADPSGIATYKPMMAGNGDFVLPIQIGRSLEYFYRAQTR